jgi:drug/metabolite transporter (DMT)-like permease
VSSALALAALGIVNTGLAYWLFYLLIDEAGAATALVIPYVMPVVAVLLGMGLLAETLTIGAIAGLVLILFGAWMAAGAGTRHRHGRAERRRQKCGKTATQGHDGAATHPAGRPSLPKTRPG